MQRLRSHIKQLVQRNTNRFSSTVWRKFKGANEDVSEIRDVTRFNGTSYGEGEITASSQYMQSEKEITFGFQFENSVLRFRLTALQEKSQARNTPPDVKEGEE